MRNPHPEKGRYKEWQFNLLALSLSARGRERTRLCVQCGTLLNKRHGNPWPHESSKQCNHHIPLANPCLPPRNKRHFCAKTASSRFLKSAYHPHSIDQQLRYLRNDYLQRGGLSFPMPTDDLCPSLNKYISRHKNSTSRTLLHQSNVLGKKAAVNFPESHPISHCKPELDQKAGILAWEERQLERNGKLAQSAEHPQPNLSRGLEDSVVKCKQNS